MTTLRASDEAPDGVVESRSLHGGEGIEDAGEPVSDHREGRHEQAEHRGAVLRVLINAACDTEQPQQPRRLEQTRHRDCLRREQTITIWA